MPHSTVIDLSHMTIDDLIDEMKGLRDELEIAQRRVGQILYDIENAQMELLRKLQVKKPQQD